MLWVTWRWIHLYGIDRLHLMYVTFIVAIKKPQWINYLKNTCIGMSLHKTGLIRRRDRLLWKLDPLCSFHWHILMRSHAFLSTVSFIALLRGISRMFCWAPSASLASFVLSGTSGGIGGWEADASCISLAKISRSVDSPTAWSNRKFHSFINS